MNPADPPEIWVSLSHFTLWCSTLSFYVGNLKDGATTIDFVKDLDIDMSNGKARMVLNALGLRSEEGRDYLSVKLDDPSFNAPIYANLFKDDKNIEDDVGETYSLIWSRPSRRNGD